MRRRAAESSISPAPAKNALPRCSARAEVNSHKAQEKGRDSAIPALPHACRSPTAIGEALPAVGSGMPAGRAAIERAAGAIGAAMEARTAALGDLDDFRLRWSDWRHRHRL